VESRPVANRKMDANDDNRAEGSTLAPAGQRRSHNSFPPSISLPLEREMGAVVPHAFLANRSNLANRK
jgi:hypothetical protein